MPAANQVVRVQRDSPITPMTTAMQAPAPPKNRLGRPNSTASAMYRYLRRRSSMRGF
jgi:hypothetical protein